MVPALMLTARRNGTDALLIYARITFRNRPVSRSGTPCKRAVLNLGDLIRHNKLKSPKTQYASLVSVTPSLPQFSLALSAIWSYCPIVLNVCGM